MTAKRDALRNRLIDAAERRLAADGLSGLRARDVAAEAGCALGSLYTVFGDLDDLVLHANGRTLDRLDEALKVEDTADSEGALVRLALTYARFARENRALWDALFDHMPGGEDGMPDWFTDKQRRVMAHVVGPLAALDPDLDEAALPRRARTYFSAVHGIVAISLQGRFVGVPGEALEAELSRFVGTLLAGMRAAERRG